MQIDYICSKLLAHEENYSPFIFNALELCNMSGKCIYNK